MVSLQPGRASTSEVRTPLATLRMQVGEFLALEDESPREDELYHRMLAIVHQICATILTCEESAISREEILDVLDPVRRIHAGSPFVRRLQTWPRGYPGDFETVEYLISGTNRAVGALARSCEAYALSRSIAQQHRNKVHHQAERLLQTLLANPGQARVASIACGSCPDFRRIAPHLSALAGELWFNDFDADALAFSRNVLVSIEERCHFRQADALSFTRRLPRGSFDLILSGGLFDYLEDRTATLLIQLAHRALRSGGTFFFTNIATGNPYRSLIEYFGNWKLLERSEEDVYRLCENAGIGRTNVSIRREETGLALLIEVTKLQ